MTQQYIHHSGCISAALLKKAQTSGADHDGGYAYALGSLSMTVAILISGDPDHQQAQREYLAKLIKEGEGIINQQAEAA